MTAPEFDIYRTELCGSATDDWTQLHPTFTFSSLPSVSKVSLSSEKSRQGSAYSIYFKEALPKMKLQYPSATFGVYSRLVAAKWESLSQQSKSVYQQKAQHRRKELIRSAAVEAAKKIALREPLKPINNSNKL